MRLIIAFLLATSFFPAFADAAPTEASFADACVKFWQASVVDQDQAKLRTVIPKVKKMCACQAKAVFAAGLPVNAIANYEGFMAGKKVASSGLEKVGAVFNGSSAKCEKAAMK
jgi:hypothetical protein